MVSNEKDFKYWKNKIHKARYILTDGENLSKKTFNWKIPADLLDLVEEKKKTFIGIGHWLNHPFEKFLCIASTHSTIFLDKTLLKKLNKAFSLGGVEYVE